MTITIICEADGNAQNASSNAALNLIGNLKGRGYNVKVLCSDEGKRGWYGYYILPKNFFNNIKVDKQVVRDAVAGADVVHFMSQKSSARRLSKYIESLGKDIVPSLNL